MLERLRRVENRTEAHEVQCHERHRAIKERLDRAGQDRRELRDAIGGMRKELAAAATAQAAATADLRERTEEMFRRAEENARATRRWLGGILVPAVLTVIGLIVRIMWTGGH